jgi:dipeptidyl-peptidase 4
MKNLLILLLALLLQIPALAQKAITVEDFTTKTTFAAKSVTGINWMKDGKFYSALDENKIVKYDITTGQAVEILVDGKALNPQIEIEDYAFSADESKVLLATGQQSIYRHSYTADYFVHDRATKATQKLSGGGRQSYASFSPDGTKVGFVRLNNLFYVDLKDMHETQVTNDGKFNEIINGTTDWVYEEEFSFVVGFYWSPDGKKLAYYRFDESAVKQYNLQKWNKGQLYPEDYKFKYPKAGEANSAVEIWVYNLDTKQKVKANLGEEKDIYVPRVTWTKDPNLVSVKKLNRLQNSLEIFHVNANDGKANLIVTEKRPTYVDLEFIDDLKYLSDGKQFIMSSEASGYKHFYLYSVTGTLVKQLTTGNYDVADLIGFDEKSKILYYTSREVSPMENQLFSVSLDGKKKLRLTPSAGNHSINMSPDCQFYIDHHGSSSTPVVASLYKTKGNVVVKVLEKNEKLAAAIAEYGIVNKEFFTVKANDGTILNGFMLKPKDFDANKTYPVLIYQYSGPGSQNVTNIWGGNHFYFHQMLTQKGYIVALIDTRGTGGRGENFKKITYKQLGKYELEDILTTGKYLGSLDYIDESRMGVWGWSYGGYMSSLAMTKGAGLFKLGIAVAPVTNWRYYDTVYTERYLQTPQENAEGYDQNSPTTYAANLQGKFLLIHGTGDDNVHMQNSIAFQEGLINAGKQFDLFYYPDKTHSILGGKTRLHLYTMMSDYITTNL